MPWAVRQVGFPRPAARGSRGAKPGGGRGRRAAAGGGQPRPGPGRAAGARGAAAAGAGRVGEARGRGALPDGRPGLETCFWQLSLSSPRGRTRGLCAGSGSRVRLPCRGRSPPVQSVACFYTRGGKSPAKN